MDCSVVIPLSLPLPLQAGALPSTADVLLGTGPSGAVATTAGKFDTAASGKGTAVITGLIPATNYTVSHAAIPPSHAAHTVASARAATRW